MKKKKIKWNEDINKPIVEISKKELDKDFEEGNVLVSFIKATIGRGCLKKTKQQKEIKLTTRTYISYGRCYNLFFPEKVIREIIVAYGNKTNCPPPILLARIKKDIEKNITLTKSKK